MIVVANIFGEATQQFPADLVVDIQLKLNTISEEEADRLKRAISKTPEELCSLIAELYSKSGIKTIERLSERDGPARLSTLLPSRFVGWLDLDSQLSAMRACELIGLYFLHINRIAEALEIFLKWYELTLQKQLKDKKRYHKGAQLVWISDCLKKLGFPALSKRYLMLTLIEDAITHDGIIKPDLGVYFRAVWSGGLSDNILREYAGIANFLSKRPEHQDHRIFPEWILQELNSAWMTEVPSPQETNFYLVSKPYCEYLQGMLGTNRGLALERLAEYLMSCMPGCRTYRRQKSHSTDYDVVCSMEGLEIDFRSEFGRYFVCECKDWKVKIGFSEFAKFCRVLDSTKAKFGILFSREGITGAAGTTDAVREQLKIFQDRDIIIVSIDEKDLKRITKGHSLIAILREKYRKVRLDLY